MKFAEYLKNAKINDSVKHLMTPGLAVEFIQPWYTPLSTTPATTGIAVGGIGSTYTVTAGGTTPLMNVVPGVQVRANKPEDLRLNDFFFRESIVNKANAPLVISQFALFQRRNAFYPLLDSKKAPVFTETTCEEAESKLNRILKDKKFFVNNKEALARWQVEWSDRTYNFIKKGDTTSPAFNRSVLIDFFDGVVGEEIASAGALTAAWDDEQTYLGQPGYDAAKMDYTALYPVSKTDFKNQALEISRTQFSYLLPNEERLSSLPVSGTEFTIKNTTAQTREITIVQVQDCFCGYAVQKDRQGVQDSSFVLTPAARYPKGVQFDFNVQDGRQVRGVEFYNQNRLAESDFDGCMGISVAWNPKDNLNVTTKPVFYQNTAATVLEAALQSGRTSKTFVKNVYSGRETIAGAITVTAVLKPKETISFQFNNVLDFPFIHLNGLESQKKYTAFYPEAFGRVQAILKETLAADAKVSAELEKSYSNLISVEVLKKVYPKSKDKQSDLKSLTLNSLSFLAEATVWDREDRFLVRECADYPFFNSLDVYFYGSFSLLAFLPRLDGAVMRHFAQAILAADDTKRRHHEYVNHPYADLPDPKLEGPRAVRGAVIHDLGNPFDAKPDAYDWHNVKEWKDLAPKFVLMVLRHYNTTGDRFVLNDCREAVYACMEYLEAMVEEGQNFPLTHGTDDTFDNLSSHGISVYCGSLWIAGLRAASRIAQILGDEAHAADWNAKSEIAAEEFHEALWDEQEGYFHFYITPIEAKDIVDDKIQALKKAVQSSIILSDSKAEMVLQINRWLNESEIPDDVALSRRQLRKFKKEWLTAQCPKAFAPSWLEKIDLDSDDVFADSMLADTYLRILELSPLTDEDKVRRSLQKVYQANYKANSPLLGAANLVHADGSPLDEFNFQAHDVWIGIQFSLITAMLMHNLRTEAEGLIESMVQNLYSEARIPFAAPEGFNGSSKLHPASIESKLGLSKKNAAKLHKSLITAKILLPDSRISPTLTRSAAAFKKTYKTIIQSEKVDGDILFTLLHNTALKYTAGKYLRPGMVFSIVQAAKFMK